MTQNLSKLATRIGKALVVLNLIVAPLTYAAAQASSQVQKPISTEPTKEDGTKDPFAAVEEEMKAKRAIKEADKEYQQNLDRAHDLSSLGAFLVTSFKEKHGLDQEDLKKLEKVEKLARGIRHAAGGSEDEGEMEKPPKDMAAAIEMLNDLSQSLRDKVEKTPKHVISAVVIDQANVLLQLIRVVRTLPSKV
jgi:hypothetical protein